MYKYITATPEEIATLIAPRGNITKGIRSTKPKDNSLAAFVWRMARFHTGADTHMPVTAQFDMQDYADSIDFGQKIYVADTPEIKQLWREMDDFTEEVIKVFGLDSLAAAKVWHKAGL